VSYNTIIELAGSPSLTARIAAAAAQEGQPEPLLWAQSHTWELAAQPGWADAWASAETAKTSKDNPDTGQRDDVITDGMILAGVQAVLAATP
jgi:hypothetical protein